MNGIEWQEYYHIYYHDPACNLSSFLELLSAYLQTDSFPFVYDIVYFFH